MRSVTSGGLGLRHLLESRGGTNRKFHVTIVVAKIIAIHDIIAVYIYFFMFVCFFYLKKSEIILIDILGNIKKFKKREWQ